MLKRTTITKYIDVAFKEFSELTAGYRYTNDTHGRPGGSAYLQVPAVNLQANAELENDDESERLSVEVLNNGLPLMSLLIEYIENDVSPVHVEGRQLTADETAILLDRYDRFVSRIYGY